VKSRTAGPGRAAGPNVRPYGCCARNRYAAWQTLKSGKQPIVVPLAIDRAGVYVVELEGRDSLGWSQVVSVDLYAGGDSPVTWAKPVTRVFSVATDKPRPRSRRVFSFHQPRTLQQWFDDALAIQCKRHDAPASPTTSQTPVDTAPTSTPTTPTASAATGRARGNCVPPARRSRRAGAAPRPAGPGFWPRVFQVDPLVCRRCGGPLKVVVAYITDSLAIRQILGHLGLRPPEKPPPQIRDVLHVPVDEEGREIELQPA
jgi:hypothetical protein